MPEKNNPRSRRALQTREHLTLCRGDEEKNTQNEKTSDGAQIDEVHTGGALRNAGVNCRTFVFSTVVSDWHLYIVNFRNTP